MEKPLCAGINNKLYNNNNIKRRNQQVNTYKRQRTNTNSILDFFFGFMIYSFLGWLWLAGARCSKYKIIFITFSRKCKKNGFSVFFCIHTLIYILKVIYYCYCYCLLCYTISRTILCEAKRFSVFISCCLRIKIA